MMKKFYFTYGTEGQPFCGGWTEITAPTRQIACGVFRAFHPDVYKGLLNCSSVYDAAQFEETEMFHNGNFGCGCHESIAVTRTVFGEECG